MSSIILGAYWLWYFCDDVLTSHLARHTAPMPIPAQPSYTSNDVSVIIPTVDTADDFTDCLRLILANNPKEIIIITVKRDFERVNKLIEPLMPLIFKGDHHVVVMTAHHASKREQSVVGMKEATGKILAIVDDDAYWDSETTLPYLLAPFENPKVGGAVGKQTARIIESRRHPKLVTPWEVAGLKSLDNQNNVQAIRFAADDGCFCLVGRTMMMRAEIAKDPSFIHNLTHEYWRGKLLNTGDDVFITRWLLTKGWDMSIQNAPQAEITTHVMDNSDLLLQMIRWQRNATQTFLSMVFYEPGIYVIWKKHPYMARKLIERLLRPVISWVHIIAFLIGYCHGSVMAYFVAAWYLWNTLSAYKRFLTRFPWASGHIWAVALLDHCYPILDVYAWITLSTETWGTRNED
ncbi:hypothetical protein C8034_v008887 [Colletotrichum sidae]|uniref:Polysaccharide synthase n=1 Tax=Colletotrichum sidae TaxID=1347389 RepID=A0A4R8T275_9PEZI|nr:hypothetical protein C8034_v008887 [Colletotrichum sidae]